MFINHLRKWNVFSIRWELYSYIYIYTPVERFYIFLSIMLSKMLLQSSDTRTIIPSYSGNQFNQYVSRVSTSNIALLTDRTTVTCLNFRAWKTLVHLFSHSLVTAKQSVYIKLLLSVSFQSIHEQKQWVNLTLCLWRQK